MITTSNPFSLRIVSSSPPRRFLQLGERPGDGITATYASSAWDYRWKHHGGDWLDANDIEQGTTPYSTATITSGTVGQSITWDVTALMRKLLSRNTAVVVKPVTGGQIMSAFSSRESAGNGPTFHIETTTGVFDVGAAADNWPADVSASVGLETLLRQPACIKPDLSAVTGTVTHARMTLKTAGGSQTIPCTVGTFYLDMPDIITQPAIQLGGVQQGIANSVSRDTALASHSSALFYDNLTSESYINSNYAVFLSPIAASGTTEFIQEPTLGVTLCRAWASTSNPRLIAWGKFLQPRNAAPAGLNGARWRRSYTFGQGDCYKELYLRYLLRIGSDYYAAFNTANRGGKLPGLNGSYANDWGPGLSNCSPAPPKTSGFDARLHWGRKSESNPHLYRIGIYWYGADHPIPTFGGVGLTRYGPRIFALEAERLYSIEQQIKLNTSDGAGGWNSDGIIRMWVDGVLFYEDTAVLIRNHISNEIQMAHINIYSGGVAPPLAAYHCDIGGICMATQYIGPPKVIA